MRSEVSSDALRLLLDVLDGGRDGFTSDEVDQAAQFLVLTAPSRYATADTIADEAASLSYDGLDTEFTSRNLGEVARMDADRARAAYLDVGRRVAPAGRFGVGHRHPWGAFVRARPR